MQEIIAASSMLRTALSSHQAASQLVTTATTTYDATLEAYRHGVGNLIVLTMADTALLDAKQTHLDAQTIAQTTAANLAFAMGDMTSARQAGYPNLIYNYLKI